VRVPRRQPELITHAQAHARGPTSVQLRRHRATPDDTRGRALPTRPVWISSCIRGRGRDPRPLRRRHQPNPQDGEFPRGRASSPTATTASAVFRLGAPFRAGVPVMAWPMVEWYLISGIRICFTFRRKPRPRSSCTTPSRAAHAADGSGRGQVRGSRCSACPAWRGGRRRHIELGVRGARRGARALEELKRGVVELGVLGRRTACACAGGRGREAALGGLVWARSARICRKPMRESPLFGHSAKTSRPAGCWPSGRTRCTESVVRSTDSIIASPITLGHPGPRPVISGA